MSASFNFSVKPASFYNAPGAKKITYERPVEIGQFSKLKDGSIRLDETELKTYRAPPLSSDLSEGFDSYVEPPTDEELPAPMDPIFRALERVSPPPSCDVVSFRNNLNKILQTPYNDRNDWKIGVTRRPEHLRLNVQLADAEKDAPRANDNQSRCGYAGRRFEAIATRPSAGTEDVAERCGLFRCALGDLTLVLAAELDARRDGEHAELKTFRTLATAKDTYVFERFKLLAFWIQSYLVGVPAIVCGFRDAEFRLKKVQTFRTEDLPKYGRKYWEPRVCLNFAYGLLTWLVERTEIGGAYHLTYHAREKVIRLRPAEVPDEPRIKRLKKKS